ncbi:TlpA family protein disulfide reductase [Maribacter sp. 2304DJ31-5]|uniref:TlpA family protein disulfide reductase n=1 Tax=Maribacter sp. 2304DJ31-5 TaxID=3386273 RepID=UPI0039BD700F
MKKITIVLVAALTIISCKVSKDYVTLSGTIANQNSDSLIVRSQTYNKKIAVNEDGTFNDTLKIKEGRYQFHDGRNASNLYLKGGYDLKLMVDTKKFDETLTFSGKGANVNNYLAQNMLIQQNVFNDFTIYDLERDVFLAKIRASGDEMSELLSSTKNLDTAFIANEKKKIAQFQGYLAQKYSDKQYMATTLAKGKASPKFTDYENYAGGTMSLGDLKGKYVYIDMWATWCGPCKAEIPFLKEVEKAYHGKNIAFVSISIDREKAYDAWRKMVADKELTGIQLYAKRDESFRTAYRITGIPRFILIDPEGNIVDADAPRPSSEKLKTLFDSLEI